MGRPTIFNEEVAAEIERRLARGQSLKRMCAEQDHLPHRDTVNDWLDKYPDFSDRVASARARGAHALIEDARDIADDGTNDWMEKHHGESTSWVVNGEALGRSKLRIEQRWREAEAHQPKVYGKRQMVEHSGSLNVTLGSDDELVAELLNLAATGRLKLPGVVLDEVTETPTHEADDEDFSDIA
jgi:hypothetical protein